MEPKLRVLALTKYGRIAASSRCRFYNYMLLLAARNISVAIAPLLSNDYVKRRLAGANIDYRDVARACLSRLSTLLSSSCYDVLWIEGELLPRWPAIFEKLLARLGRPFVVDVDDAIFHTYDRHPRRVVREVLGHKIDIVFARATAVVAGNDYIAARARQAGARRVVLVPTTVDYRAYAKKRKLPVQDKLTFGWIGSTATEHYLQTIAPELEWICTSLPAGLRLIGVERPNFPYSDAVCRIWSEDTEIEELAACDIGLAPLSDGYWERGKCGLKAIQYMAAGIPVLAANVGVLPSIVRHGDTGLVYRNRAEFRTFARQLAEDAELRQRMGAAGKERVAACFSTEAWADTIAGILAEAGSSRLISRVA